MYLYSTQNMQNSQRKIIHTEDKRIYDYKPLGVNVNTHSKIMNSHTKKTKMINKNLYKNILNLH